MLLSCPNAREKHHGTGAGSQSIPSPAGHTARASRTELFLAPVTVQVDPQLAADVVLHTWVLLIVQPIQGPAHHCVHLAARTKGMRPSDPWEVEQLGRICASLTARVLG